MEEISFRFFYHLEKAIKTYRQFAQNLFREQGFDITIDQWLLLKVLQDEPVISQNELAERVFKDKASITRIIDLLVAKDYLKRASNDQNRRRKQLTITSEGESIIKALHPIVMENRRTALGKLSGEEIESTEKVLRSIIGSCTQSIQQNKTYDE